ncbi:hypothetical protein [Pyrococcus kukulkanii]|uniref:KaiC-like domain-containing protein n=1 Tax=Pyrococcus kukulkanii TaxID=1609559 RepID=A0ABV4T5B8_9EURY
MKVLSTGIKKLDNIVGGGIVEDTVFTIIYDTYSYGWALGIKILLNRIREGDFGVILNTVLPISSLDLETELFGLKIREEGEKGNLVVIDLFATANGINYPHDYVYTIGSLDPSTYLPKFLSVYRKILEEKIKDKRPIGIVITMDGYKLLMGENHSIKLVQKSVAIKETARITEKRKRPINIWLLNKDRVSKEYISWLALYSQYIIEVRSSEEAPGYEMMFVRKSPLPDFEPGVYKLYIKGGNLKIE